MRSMPVLVLTAMFVSESRDQRPRTFDIPGQLLFMAAVGAFAFAVIEGPRAGWASRGILSLFIVSATAFAVFVYAERRSADPMMDLTLFRDRTYSLAIVTIFAVLFAVYGMLLVITQYLQNVRSFTPAQAGLILLPVVLLSALALRFTSQDRASVESEAVRISQSQIAAVAASRAYDGGRSPSRLRPPRAASLSA